MARRQRESPAGDAGGDSRRQGGPDLGAGTSVRLLSPVPAGGDGGIYDLRLSHHTGGSSPGAARSGFAAAGAGIGRGRVAWNCLRDETARCHTFIFGFAIVAFRSAKGASLSRSEMRQWT